MADEPKSIWTKLVVISGVLSALAALIGALNQCDRVKEPEAAHVPASNVAQGGSQNTGLPPASSQAPAPQTQANQVNAYTTPQGSYPATVNPAQVPQYQPSPYRAPQVQVVAANFCCDLAGNRRCPLVATVAAGTGCFCPGQGAGISCP